MPTIPRSFAEVDTLLKALYEQYKSGAGDFYILERMHRLMGVLGNPQNSLRVLHVAGTSGKTSTAYYLAALLQANGNRVGLSVSPHISEVNERVQINLIPLPEPVFCEAFGEFWDLVKSTKIRPTYFETLVAFAYWQFARMEVDYAVIEVGLGGLLDATNVVSSENKVCVITDIGLDHTHILGDTLQKIAAHKAGIIQPHNDVFMYQQEPAVMGVVTDTVQRQQANLHVITPNTTNYPELGLVLFQKRNLGLAEQAVRFVCQRDGHPQLTANMIRQAASTAIPGRMELFRIGERTLIVDGAHNEQKMTALVNGIEALYPDQPIAALIASVHGSAERWQRSLNILLPLLSDCIVTSFHQEAGDRIKSSVEASTIAAYIHDGYDTRVQVEPDVKKAFQALLACQEPILLATGSLYLLQDILRLVAEL